MRRSALILLLAGPLLGGCTIQPAYVNYGHPVHVRPHYGRPGWNPPPVVRVRPAYPDYRVAPRHVRPHHSWGRDGERRGWSRH